MADDVDRATHDAEVIGEAHINGIRALAAKMPKGEPGICNYCNEDFERLVSGHCGRCRDLLKLP